MSSSEPRISSSCEQFLTSSGFYVSVRNSIVTLRKESKLVSTLTIELAYFCVAKVEQVLKRAERIAVRRTVASFQINSTCRCNLFLLRFWVKNIINKPLACTSARGGPGVNSALSGCSCSCFHTFSNGGSSASLIVL